MSRANKQKGARGEKEWRDVLRSHGYDARRERDGRVDVSHNVRGIHFEVKRREKLDIPAHCSQAKRDAGTGNIPVVAFRSNRQPWRVILDADDFLALLKEREPNGSPPISLSTPTIIAQGEDEASEYNA